MKNTYYYLMLGVCIVALASCGPSAQTVETAIAQTSSASSPQVATDVPTGCPGETTPVIWSEVQSYQSGDVLCIYGKIVKIDKDSDGRSTVTFSDAPKTFFILVTDSLKPFTFEGDCIIVFGEVKTNIQGTPYVLTDGQSINTCPK
jgi:hypothetical protein